MNVTFCEVKCFSCYSWLCGHICCGETGNSKRLTANNKSAGHTQTDTVTSQETRSKIRKTFRVIVHPRRRAHSPLNPNLLFATHAQNVCEHGSVSSKCAHSHALTRVLVFIFPDGFLSSYFTNKPGLMYHSWQYSNRLMVPAGDQRLPSMQYVHYHTHQNILNAHKSFYEFGRPYSVLK